jgi:hypothetical protein
MRRFALMIGLMVAIEGSAFAQDRKTELSAGWRYYHSEDTSYPKGWYVDLATNLTPSDVTLTFAVVGEVGGTYKSRDDSQVIRGLTYSGSVDFSMYTFMGGARVRAASTNPQIMPFGQILFGAARQKTSVDLSTSGPGTGTLSFSDESSDTDAALALDGGVDVNAGESLRLRVAAGYFHVFGDSDSNAFRASVGVVIPF